MNPDEKIVEVIPNKDLLELLICAAGSIYLGLRCRKIVLRKILP